MKTTTKSHYVPSGLPAIQKTDHPNVGEQLSSTISGNVTSHSHFGKTVWQFLKKLNRCLPPAAAEEEQRGEGQRAGGSFWLEGRVRDLDCDGDFTIGYCVMIHQTML
jgi:hypothetical protein